MNITKKPHRCNGCMAENEITFKTPRLFSPSYTKYTCVNCQSTFSLKISRDPKEPVVDGNVILEYRVIHYDMSSKLRKILIDQKNKASKNPFDKMES